MGKTQYNLGVYQSYSIIASRDLCPHPLLLICCLPSNPLQVGVFEEDNDCLLLTKERLILV